MATDLYSLLPAVDRQRDEAAGSPLAGLLRIIQAQHDLLDADIRRLRDNFFIETAEPWVVPYIGDLVGTRPLFDGARVAASETLARIGDDLRGPRLVPEIALRARADVARTIYYRLRKATPAMLEELARDVTGWAAHVVEFFKLLGWTQCVRNHIRPNAARTPDLRDRVLLDHLNGPFDTIAHTVDVRPIDSESGWYDIEKIGFFVWRLRAYEVHDSPTYAPAAAAWGRHVSPLGSPAPLFSRWRREGDEFGVVTPLHVPAPITPVAWYTDLFEHGTAKHTDYYGLFTEIDDVVVNPEELDVSGVSSLAIFVDGMPVPPRRLVCANLENWIARPIGDKVAVDVVRGRIGLGDTIADDALVDVYYHYGFSADLGGGPYERGAWLVRGDLPQRVIDVPSAEAPSRDDALGVWDGESRPNTVIRILDERTHTISAPIVLPAGGWLVIEAATETRPHLLLGAPLDVSGADDSAFTLSGLLVEGSVHVTGDLGRLRLLHTTLVPGRGLSDVDGAPESANPSIEVEGGTSAAPLNTRLDVELAFSITGPLRIPSTIQRLAICDSIIDGIGTTAICAPGTTDGPGPALTVERTTILGATYCAAIPLATEVIFDGLVSALRTQDGCVRFSFVRDAASRTPRRYRCQPDLEIATRVAAGDPADEAAIALTVRQQLVPEYTTTRYGQPAYAQLHLHCPIQIRTGAEDGSEMGAFCHLAQPQRESNLRLRLEEYLPFGLDPGIIYVT